MFLLIGKDIFVDLFYFFLQIVDLAPDHRQLLLNSVLIVSIDQFFVFIVNVTQLGEMVDHGLSFLKLRIELRYFLFVVFDDFMEMAELAIDTEMVESRWT